MTGLALGLLVLLAARAAAPDDAALARGIREGDPAAFRAFFDRYHAPLLGYLRRRGVPDDVADDIAQTAFVKLWERREAIDPSRSVRGFLFRVGHTRALNHFRDTAKFDASAETDRARPADAADAVDAGLLRARLEASVAALPDRRRTVFELCFFRGLTYRETAQVLSISPKTVEHQMGHAFRTLRAALADFREDRT